jgi:hypothetical protein
VNVLKIKKMVSVLLMYVLLLALVPADFLAASVKAAEVSVQTDLYQVKNYNMLSDYNNGLAMYGNYGLIVSGTKLYMVKENYFRVAYESKFGIEGFSGVKGDNAYLYSTNYGNGKNVTVVNLKTFESKVINISSNEKDSCISSSVIDKNGALWFSVTNYSSNGSNAYSILCLDPNTSQTKVLKLDASKISELGQLVTDNDGSVWFKAENKLNNTQKMVKLTYNNDITSTEYSTNAKINKYNYIINDGSVWFKNHQDSNYYFLQLSLKNGVFDVNKSIKTSDTSSILADGNGKLWTNNCISNDYLNGIHVISKLEGDKFVPKYITSFGGYGKVSITDDSHMLIVNEKYDDVNQGTAYAVINDATKVSLLKVSNSDVNKNITEIQNKIKKLTETLNNCTDQKDIKGIQDTKKELNIKVNELLDEVQMYNEISGK